MNSLKLRPWISFSRVAENAAQGVVEKPEIAFQVGFVETRRPHLPEIPGNAFPEQVFGILSDPGSGFEGASLGMGRLSGGQAATSEFSRMPNCSAFSRLTPLACMIGDGLVIVGKPERS
jgi:hypothetical protein